MAVATDEFGILFQDIRLDPDSGILRQGMELTRIGEVLNGRDEKAGVIRPHDHEMCFGPVLTVRSAHSFNRPSGPFLRNLTSTRETSPSFNTIKSGIVRSLSAATFPLFSFGRPF